ncbi:hypothetical protein IMZ48_41285, partial [Candidatus Bathyarchaeota archaeon]|nr:hypothetical protein [Candidatus Bathyarchaeota archaeon]
DVPLDYTDPDGDTLSLSLAKVPAAKGPSKGSILMNFGGPGGEAIRTLGKKGPLLLKYETVRLWRSHRLCNGNGQD